MIEITKDTFVNDHKVDRQDIIAAYWVFLGRMPESDLVIDDKSLLMLSELAAPFLQSSEFSDRVDSFIRDKPSLIDENARISYPTERLQASDFLRTNGLLSVATTGLAIECFRALLDHDQFAAQIASLAGLPSLSDLLQIVDRRLIIEKSTREIQSVFNKRLDKEAVNLAYSAVLGRLPETSQIATFKTGTLLGNLVIEILDSREFIESVVSPILNRELLVGERFQDYNDNLLLWAEEHFLINGTKDNINSAKQFLSSVLDSALSVFVRSRVSLSYDYVTFREALRRADDGLSRYQSISGNIVEVFDESYLHLVTNRVHDLPSLRVDGSAPRRINVLVPAFDFKSMSAGFFGVFQVARFVASCGYRVRLVMFDNFYWNEHEFRQKLLGYPGMEELFDELEFIYIGDRSTPLTISPADSSVATVWYSAYFAQKISLATKSQPFLYLIQDYETNFFASSTLSCLAEQTYSMNYHALFSTETLRDFFVNRGVGVFGIQPPAYIYFNNACASQLPPKQSFMAEKDVNRLAFYSRPVVNRNMFELGALALINAYKQGVFDGNWEFVGVGMGDVAIKLACDRSLLQMPRMNLRDYTRAISKFDIGLCLMASPHPSLLPFDLAGSGAVVVTNSFASKDQSYFDQLASNVIARKPSVEAIVDGLASAVERLKDRHVRYRNAELMTYPKTWGESLTSLHEDFIRNTFK